METNGKYSFYTPADIKNTLLSKFFVEYSGIKMLPMSYTTQICTQTPDKYRCVPSQTFR